MKVNSNMFSKRPNVVRLRLAFEHSALWPRNPSHRLPRSRACAGLPFAPMSLGDDNAGTT